MRKLDCVLVGILLPIREGLLSLTTSVLPRLGRPKTITILKPCLTFLLAGHKPERLPFTMATTTHDKILIYS
ncbi:MAG: hypothetical protein JST68_13950 [Bacteroidetes bacterium]|nr:hypothetical protein [Bacteroidota bacterium]